MAVSPCPKCQDKETFDDMWDNTSCERPAYVVQRTPRKDDGPEFFCTKDESHNWPGLTPLHTELKQAGYC